MAVQKRAFDWESLQVMSDGQGITDIKAIDWSDTYGVTPIYGAGGTPIAWGRRNYRAQGSMELSGESYAKFTEWCRLQGGIYHASFNLLLSYGDNALSGGYPAKQTCTLSNCMLSRRGGASRQGAAEARIVRLEFEILNGIIEFDANVLEFLR